MVPSPCSFITVSVTVLYPGELKTIPVGFCSSEELGVASSKSQNQLSTKLYEVALKSTGQPTVTSVDEASNSAVGTTSNQTSNDIWVLTEPTFLMNMPPGVLSFRKHGGLVLSSNSVLPTAELKLALLILPLVKVLVPP